MGKKLMHAAFFIALIGIGQAVVESDFGTKPSGFFTPSTLMLATAIILYVIGEILIRKEKKIGKKKKKLYYSGF